AGCNVKLSRIVPRLLPIVERGSTDRKNADNVQTYYPAGRISDQEGGGERSQGFPVEPSRSWLGSGSTDHNEGACKSFLRTRAGRQGGRRSSLLDPGSL